MSKPIEVYEGQVGAFDRGSFLVVNGIVTDPLHDHYGKRVRVTVEVLDV